MVIKLEAGTFYGSTMRKVSVSGFSFTEKSYELQKTLPRHEHEFAHFCFVLAGNYTEEVGKVTAERSPMTLIFYPPGAAHAEKHHTDGRHFIIEFEPPCTEILRDYSLTLDDPLAYSNLSNSLAARLYREFRNGDEFSALALEAMTMELMVETLRRRRKHNERQAPKWLDQVRQILHAGFSEPLGLDYLAEMVGVHPVHLVRVFRRFEHCTVSEYIRGLRIEYARQRMLSSKETLVEIALSSGFADQTHFSRSFKLVTGMTPSEFKKNINLR
jgi:AraC-like DNA-binding protein